MKFQVNHDLHCHSTLSSCCSDANQTIQAIYDRAVQQGLETQCITDHLWDSAVPGPSNWYAPQNIEHVKQGKAELEALTAGQEGGPRMVFGCETEYCGGRKLGLSKEGFEEFDFVIIPPNHYHMINFTRDESINTEEAIAELFVQRLEELTELDLPWEKVGIAHLNGYLTFREGDPAKVYAIMDEARLQKVFTFLAARGAGIEINTSCFGSGWREREEDQLRLFKIARDCGCKFYIGSDAHSLEGMEGMMEVAREVVDLLELTEEQRYQIP